MPKMNGEKFPYPKSGAQPAAMDRPHAPTSIVSGGANDIYSPEVPDVASTSIYNSAVPANGIGRHAHESRTQVHNQSWMQFKYI